MQNSYLRLEKNAMTATTRPLALTAATLSLSALAYAGMGERMLDRRSETIDASAATTIVIEVEAGSLEVIGRPHVTEATIEADFVARVSSAREAKRILAQLALEHAVHGSRLVVRSRTDGGSWRREGGRINLTVVVPAGLPLTIKDGSGWIKVRDMGVGVAIHVDH